MSQLLLAPITILSLTIIGFTFLKRENKKRILKEYRAFSGEKRGGFLGEYINLFFPICKP